MPCVFQLLLHCITFLDTAAFHPMLAVPRCYRSRFPEQYKTHLSHDIVLMCRECHKVCVYSADLSSPPPQPLPSSQTLYAVRCTLMSPFACHRRKAAYDQQCHKIFVCAVLTRHHLPIYHNTGADVLFQLSQVKGRAFAFAHGRWGGTRSL